MQNAKFSHIAIASENSATGREVNVSISMRAARVNAGFSQSDISEKLGVSKSTVSRWENGRGHPNRIIFEKYCELCHVHVNDIKEAENGHRS